MFKQEVKKFISSMELRYEFAKSKKSKNIRNYEELFNKLKDYTEDYVWVHFDEKTMTTTICDESKNPFLKLNNEGVFKLNNSDQ